MQTLEGYSGVQMEMVEPSENRLNMHFVLYLKHTNQKQKKASIYSPPFHMACPALDQNNSLHVSAAVSSYGICTVSWPLL